MGTGGIGCGGERASEEDKAEAECRPENVERAATCADDAWSSVVVKFWSWRTRALLDWMEQSENPERWLVESLIWCGIAFINVLRGSRHVLLVSEEATRLMTLRRGSLFPFSHD